MTVARLLVQPDAVRDIGILITKLFVEFEKLGFKVFHLLKFILYDVTVLLNRLPFGNWISVLYFITMSNLIKNIVEGGEFNRLLGRAIHLYFIQQKSYSECASRFSSYLWRITMAQIHEIQSWSYGVMVYVWDYTGGSVKREVKRFAKEVVLENAEEIEKVVKEMVKTAAFSAMVNTVSQKLASELGPVAMDAFSKSDIAKSIVDIQTLSLTRGNENTILLNQKLAEISMQLEYLRLNQPNQFREILKTISLSTLALNDIGVVPSTIVDTFAKLTGTLGSSSPRRRIESI